MDHQTSAKTEVLSTDTPALFAEAVRRAADLLRADQVVALPTETVYGLAANARSTLAVAQLFTVKGRPAQNPVIVHVNSIAMARSCVTKWPEIADKLAHAFWPGPLTLVLPRAGDIPELVTGGGPTVGVRWPSHPFMQAVIAECGFPLAAPSANLASRLSPTNAEHVRKALGGRIRLIIDGGQAQVGIESTVLDVSVRPPRLLRPGIIHEPALAAVIGQLAGGSDTTTHLRSPGLMAKHYAPKAKLALWSWRNEKELRAHLAAEKIAASKTHIISHTNIPSAEGLGEVSVIPHDAEAFARAIYAELHRCDDAGADFIIVEALPNTIEWRALKDRLNRAATR